MTTREPYMQVGDLHDRFLADSRLGHLTLRPSRRPSRRPPQSFLMNHAGRRLASSVVNTHGS